jgi:hypothetical protein
MECPKCGFVQDAIHIECARCGVVFAKVRARNEAAAAVVDHGRASMQAQLEPTPNEQEMVCGELRARALAMPCALVSAWAAVKTSPGLVRIFTMWIHESGHAVAAWLCGYMAWPGPWFTPVGVERSLVLTTTIVGLAGFGALRAWQRQRWFWVVVAAVVLLLTLCCTLLLREGQARQLITFAGDGGCFVLGSALMLTTYARADHPVRTERLRWALLIFGALAFMDVYLVWSGPFDRLPFGEDERGLSDPAVLVEEFGWSVVLLVDRYLELAHGCFVVLVAAYAAGIVQSSMRPPFSGRRGWRSRGPSGPLDLSSETNTDEPVDAKVQFPTNTKVDADGDPVAGQSPDPSSRRKRSLG